MNHGISGQVEEGLTMEVEEGTLETFLFLINSSSG